MLVNELALWEEFRRTGSIELRNRLVIRHLRLAQHAAQKILSRLPPRITENDLSQTAALGLISAVDRFDHRRGVKFVTFALLRINGAILDELRAQDWSMRRARSIARLIRKANAELGGRLGRRPTLEEMARHLGVSLEKAREYECEANIARMTSLSVVEATFAQEDDDRAHGSVSILADPRARDPADVAAARDIVEYLFSLVENRRWRQVLELRYRHALSFTDIGRLIRVTDSAVSQMHAEAIRHLQKRCGVPVAKHAKRCII